jgi:hypothetical protein
VLAGCLCDCFIFGLAPTDLIILTLYSLVAVDFDKVNEYEEYTELAIVVFVGGCEADDDSSRTEACTALALVPLSSGKGEGRTRGKESDSGAINKSNTAVLTSSKSMLDGRNPGTVI